MPTISSLPAAGLRPLSSSGAPESREGAAAAAVAPVAMPSTIVTHSTNFEFVTSDIHDPDVRALIGAPLREFNQRIIGPNHFRPLCIAIKDERGDIVGGLWGHTACGWLYTEMLVVPEASRGAGLGTQLMSVAENEALQRGCHSAWLDTHGFQAKGFYEKLGYMEFGRLENFPTGHARHYFQKRLQSTVKFTFKSSAIGQYQTVRDGWEEWRSLD